ncbi:hypothetical protein [Catellatospora tritici]|uniref:hypothetical protein n=1 Tax=Catellatospora tritici TaxID=2851566 RepID=UPI001C2DD172|nr:hypothetical protein [Catellatospora tritici]MBV1855865.1 hypothetical protein [Catellatospora tritici]
MSAQSTRIVGVEFGREAVPRSFTTLLPPELRAGYVRVDPLDNPDIQGAVRTIESQAEHWAAVLAADPAPPTVVLGYCSGSGFASELAARLGGNPQLILVDPGAPDAEDAQELLIELATGMDEDLAPQDVPDLLGRNADDALAVIGDFLTATIQRCAPELDQDIAEALTSHQRGWMSYTLAAGAHGGALPKEPAHVLLSEAAEWDRTRPGEVHQFPVDPVALFSDAAAAAAVAAAVAARL